MFGLFIVHFVPHVIATLRRIRSSLTRFVETIPGSVPGYLPLRPAGAVPCGDWSVGYRMIHGLTPVAMGVSPPAGAARGRPTAPAGGRTFF